MQQDIAFDDLTDGDLLRHVGELAAGERGTTARLVTALAELDRRRLYLGAGCRSLFTYCTEVLRLSEHAAYGRITAARAARRFPTILDRLADGSVHLTTIGLLAPLLTADNHIALLDAARHKTRREVEQLVASTRPQPPVPTVVRKLPAVQRPESGIAVPRAEGAPSPAGTVADDRAIPARPLIPDPEPAFLLAGPVAEARPRPALILPLSTEQYKIQFTASRETHDKLRRAQDLLRHVIPDGDAAAVIDRALTLLLAELERSKLAMVRRPRHGSAASKGSRHVPASVRRLVWARDEGRCAFTGSNGRCTERGGLEFHHVVPFAAGGATDAANLQLRCRAHNAYEAEQFFGPLTARESPAEYGGAAGWGDGSNSV